MEAKKTSRSNLENKRFIFREIGLVIALAVVFFAFETKFYQEETKEIILVDTETIEDDVLPIVVPQQASRPLPKIKMMPIDYIDIVNEELELDDPDIIDVTESQNGSINGIEGIEDQYSTGTGDEEFDETIPFLNPELMPKFNGDLNKWLRKNLNYPERARESGVQGKIFIEFIVEKDGSLTHIEVVRSVDPYYDKEAVRIAKLMPKWIPGKHNGETVRVKYTLPIQPRFQ